MKTAIAELIETNNRNIEKLKELSKNETNRFYHGMLTYAQSFNLDLHHFKKLEKEIIDRVHQDSCKENSEPLDLNQGCENEFCENCKIELHYGGYISCSICEDKE